ncbi:hypothetical protein Ga0003345_1829 [Idiomarinaceae bacterium HL-53]|nr:hypothetical protein Ga0003345_1829 [Idiomarinaceae bacterium HL-53]
MRLRKKLRNSCMKRVNQMNRALKLVHGLYFSLRQALVFT